MGEASGTPNFEHGIGYHSVNNTELEDRMIALIETVPFIDLTPNQIDDLSEELRDYHHIYSPLFARREQAQWAEKYMQGLLLDIPRKSIEPMVLALEGANPNAVRAMQHFASEGTWQDTRLLKQHLREVDQDIGDPTGVLIVDGSDFPKQGNDSVGVARQYCGQLGKVANCQAGVFLGYASRKGYTLLDRRLYLPEEWVFARSISGATAAVRRAGGYHVSDQARTGSGYDKDRSAGRLSLL